jgi:hypothetical protein
LTNGYPNKNKNNKNNNNKVKSKPLELFELAGKKNRLEPELSRARLDSITTCYYALLAAVEGGRFFELL